MRDPDLINQFSSDRLSSRQIDELLGIARGLCADGSINQAEVEFLQKWLAANAGIAENPLINTLYRRVSEFLADGIVDENERCDLFDTLNRFADDGFELGETLKATTLPLCNPPPDVSFEGRSFCFTGIFSFGARSLCEEAVEARGGSGSSLKKSTDYLVIGVYATESWKHSTFGNKILRAVELRDEGVPISIISEEYWRRQL